jgi:hypothetical protein
MTVDPSNNKNRNPFSHALTSFHSLFIPSRSLRTSAPHPSLETIASPGFPCRWDRFLVNEAIVQSQLPSVRGLSGAADSFFLKLIGCCAVSMCPAGQRKQTQIRSTGLIVISSLVSGSSNVVFPVARRYLKRPIRQSCSVVFTLSSSRG